MEINNLRYPEDQSIQNPHIVDRKPSRPSNVDLKPFTPSNVDRHDDVNRNVDAAESEKPVPIIISADDHSLKILENAENHSLDDDWSIRNQDEWQGQMLHQASLYNNTELLQCLLSGPEKDSIDIRDTHGRTAVYTAVSNNCLAALKMLLMNGANPDIPANEAYLCRTPLHTAIIEAKPDMARLLLRHNANPDFEDKLLLTPSFLADQSHLKEMKTIMEEERVRKLMAWREQVRALCVLCQAGDVDQVRLLLTNLKSRATFFVNECVEGEFPPLLCACRSGSVDMVQFLLDEGAGGRADSKTGLTCLHVACQEGQKDMAELLLKKFPKLSRQRNADEQLPIHFASAHRSELVQMLLEHPYPMYSLAVISHASGNYHYLAPFDINSTDCHQRTPLFYACQEGNLSTVHYLLDHEVTSCHCQSHQLEQSFSSQSDTLSMHRHRSDSRISEDAEEEHRAPSKPVVMDTYNTDGQTALHAAIANGHHNIVDLLLQHGADINAEVKSKDFDTSSLLLACQKGDVLMAELLLRHGAKDKDNKCFVTTQLSQDHEIMTTLLKYKSSKELVYSINKACMTDSYMKAQSDQDVVESFDSCSLTYRTKFPTSAVAINWQNLASLSTFDQSWLETAALFHNDNMQAVSPWILYAITKIDMSSNSFTEFPDLLLTLPSLRSLMMSHNDIAAFPDEPIYSVSDLKASLLEELIIDHNRLKNLPPYLFKLPCLTRLVVSHNKIKEICVEYLYSQSLVALDLSDNLLEYLSSPLVMMRPAYRPPTSSLSLTSGSSLRESYSSIDSMFRERSLTVDSGDTMTVESDFMDMDVNPCNHWQSKVKVTNFLADSPTKQHTGLKYLNLSSNKLTELPDCFPCFFPKLETLILSHNKLTTMGSIAYYPMELSYLDLSNNLMKTLGFSEEMCPLDAQMCYNKVTNRNSSLSQSSYCPHRCHSSLDLLRTLDLSNNRLSRLDLTSVTPLHHRETEEKLQVTQETLLFPNILELEVNGNCLESLPSAIGRLTSLRNLGASYNKIKELPPEMGLLKKLWRLDLDNCPLQGPIQEMLTRNTHIRDIIGFLNSTLEEATEYNCMNLMLVGVHNIGKTALLQYMRKECKQNRPVKHWLERVYNQKVHDKNVSTVGIDINELSIERKKYGCVTFRTWDFGGQREYYATHQYFLSVRSLYLVLWKITDGEKGVNSVLQWLVNIQARSPGSHVIIVGTHLDILKDRATRRSYPDGFEEDMMARIQELFIDVAEPEKCGLPNVISAWNVSCKSGLNIKQLVDLVYDTAFQVTHPKSRNQTLLRQKIPKKYLTLQKVVQGIAFERRRDNQEPVLSHELYKATVMNKMMEKAQVTFTSMAEMEQATRFLHENGFLFHYEEPGLQDLYFLDPQWLCDLLAKVVSIREVNLYINNGLMKMENLRDLFKNTTFERSRIQDYIITLLNKFEVALQFDNHNLLLPSLLPTESHLVTCILSGFDIQVPLRRKGKAVELTDTVSSQYLNLSNSLPTPVTLGQSNFFSGQVGKLSVGDLDNRRGTSLLLGKAPCYSPMFAYNRLYLMTYVPSGFWPRLITRLLADEGFFDLVKSMYKLIKSDGAHSAHIDSEVPTWHCWQTGIELLYMNTVVMIIKEVVQDRPGAICRYEDCQLMAVIEDGWQVLDQSTSCYVEICLPSDFITHKLSHPHLDMVTVTLQREEKIAARLLAQVVEYVDSLLHDWYPELGELRFSQNCQGRYLITRLIPCPQCIQQQVCKNKRSAKDKTSWTLVNSLIDSEFAVDVGISNGHPKLQKRRTESTGSTGMLPDGVSPEDTLICFLVEMSMHRAIIGRNEMCPFHGSLSPSYACSLSGSLKTLHIAPDVNFFDVDDDIQIRSDDLEIGPLIGTGAFGSVHSGKIINKMDGTKHSVAVKVLYHKPTSKSYQLESACQSYLTTRQELAILQTVHHDHILQLIGMTVKPLCLIMSLAPEGDLKRKLDELHDNDSRLPVFSIQQVTVQISLALQYLHGRNIIYRDLKSDNVLVWSLPMVASLVHKTHVKLADYGISRAVLPTGAKGYGGTPPFIAPEILQHAGRDTYDEKVDCFSFGMFLYELVTGRTPMYGVPNPTTRICNGGRPDLAMEEAAVPMHILDLMTICWSQHPRDRPVSSEILGIASCPKFTHLLEAICLESTAIIFAACSINSVEPTEPSLLVDVECYPQIWLSTTADSRCTLEVLSYKKNKCFSHRVTQPDLMTAPVVALLAVGEDVWCASTDGIMHVFSAHQYRLIHQFEFTTRSPVQVLAMYHLPGTSDVLVTLASGPKKIILIQQAFCYKLDDIFTSQRDMQEFVGSGKDTNCTTLVTSEKRIELWQGKGGGKISIWDVDSRKEVCQLDHYEPTDSTITCLLLASSGNSVWSYNYPGFVVFRWDVSLRQIKEQLNCSLLVPKSEKSIQSVPLHVGKCQVTALNVVDSYLYVATTWGCLIVADCETMNPLSILRSHGNKEFYTKTILPLERKGETDKSDMNRSSTDVSSIVTVGKGYVDLVTQVLGQDEDLVNKKTLERQSSFGARHSVMSPTYKEEQTFALTWLAEDWEYY